MQNILVLLSSVTLKWGPNGGKITGTLVWDCIYVHDPYNFLFRDKPFFT